MSERLSTIFEMNLRPRDNAAFYDICIVMFPRYNTRRETQDLLLEAVLPNKHKTCIRFHCYMSHKIVLLSEYTSLEVTINKIVALHNYTNDKVKQWC